MRSKRKYQSVTALMVILFIAGIFYYGIKWNYSGNKSYVSSDNNGISDQDNEETMTGIVKTIDSDEGTITISDIKKSLDTKFTYSDGTEFIDKYDQIVTVNKIDLGSIVDIEYNGKTNKLYSLSISKDAWIYPDVTKMKVDKDNQIIQLGEKNYSYSDGLVIIGEDRIITMLDIGEKDQLRICGIDNEIYSIVVTKGHGYIRFINYDDFVGGSLAVGSSIFMSVREDMDVVAREGTYTVTMTNGELTGSKKVTVKRDDEVTVDMSEFTIGEDRIGKVTFNISPYGADLYVNGTKTDYSEPVSLNYGEHKIVVYLAGYKSFTGVLTVGQEEQSIDIELAASSSDDESTAGDDVTATEDTSQNDTDDINLDWNSDAVTSSPVPSGTVSPSTSNDVSTISPSPSPTPQASVSPSSETASMDADHQITVQQPEGAEVYLDNAYKGIAPVSFTKVLGEHTITLKKDGYEDKIYSINVEDDNQNVYYKFSELVSD